MYPDAYEWQKIHKHEFQVKRYKDSRYGWWVKVEGINSNEAAMIGAELAWFDWAHELGPDFTIYVDGEEYRIDVEMVPAFNAKKVEDSDA